MIADFFVELIAGTISGFIGFFFALYVEKRKDKENQINRIIVIIKSIAEELTDISATLKQYVDKEQTINRRIYTPNFDTLMSSGMIIELVEKDIYPYIIDGFSLIKRLNDERDSLSCDERNSYMKEIIGCANNVKFLTKKYKAEVK